MFHIAAVISKVTGKYLYYKDYWDKYTDQEPFFKFFAAYIPFVVREKENTYKMIRWDKLRIAFGNFNEIIMIIAGTVETSDKMFENYLIESYQMLLSIFGDLTAPENIPQNIGEFARELELMIRVSATKEDLEKMDWTIQERYEVTQASEEVNRRTALQSEQAAKVLDQFAVEMLDGTVTKFRLFLTAGVTLKDAIHYEVTVDFSTYPHPPIFTFPPKLHDILGDAGEALETIQGWDPVNPPEWAAIIQELEQKVYRSETHLIEPIIEEAEVPDKKKGFAKQLSLPSRKEPKGIPYPQDKPKEAKEIAHPSDVSVPSPKEAKGTVILSPEKTQIPPSSPPKPKFIPFQAHPPPEAQQPSAPQSREKKDDKKREIVCENCGFIFKSEDEKTCQLCGSPRPE
jgi:hypothetical protein